MAVASINTALSNTATIEDPLLQLTTSKPFCATQYVPYIMNQVQDWSQPSSKQTLGNAVEMGYNDMQSSTECSRCADVIREQHWLLALVICWARRV